MQHRVVRTAALLVLLALCLAGLQPAGAQAPGEKGPVPDAAGGWVIETVDTTGVVGLYSSLALDAEGRPHISYHDETNGDLKYATHDGSEWQIQTVDSEGNVGPYTSLALDAQGHPHISYRDTTHGDLKYAAHDGTAWQIETVPCPGIYDYGYDTSLALDAAGRPHISHVGVSPIMTVNLHYTYYDGAAWQMEVVDGGGPQVIAGQSLALDSAGLPHISYGKGGWTGPHDLMYATHDGDEWQIETVDSGGSNSLALDAGGRPHISYYDSTNDVLKYAYHDGAAWQIETVDSPGEVGWDTSLALDGAGRPYISYYDSSNQDLKIARHDGAGWRIRTVDWAGTVGLYTSLALDGGRWPHISYYDWTNGDLKYAHVEPTPTLFVGNIRTTYQTVDPGPPPSYGVIGRVPIYDEAKMPVAGASVTAQWELPDGQIRVGTATTRPNGSAHLRRISQQVGAYVITVLDVQKEGYLYDPAMNVETSEELIVP